MKANFRFWRFVLIGLALTVLGYFGFITTMPDKTSGSLIPLFFCCFLMLVSGVVILVVTSIYAIVRMATEHRRSKTEDV
jgi:hypothetical protein